MQYDYLRNNGFVPAVNEYEGQRGMKITKNAFGIHPFFQK
jgi:hypothetical protein